MKTQYKKTIEDTPMNEARLLTLKKGDNEYEIDIKVPEGHRCKGIGTGLLTEVTSDADNEGATLYAKPEPPDGNEENKKRLIKLYKKFGFEFQGDWSKWTGTMIRKPHR